MLIKHSKNTRKILIFVVSCAMVMTMDFGTLQASAYQNSDPSPQYPSQNQPEPAQLTAQQLQELVAPIALYPDALVAQILAASAYPTQVVEAQRYLQENPNLKGAELGAEVDKQDWDPSVKALTQFPTVLADMDKNISWTSELGDVNLNQSADVMNAVQVLRQQAQKAGNLKSTPQQTVTNQNSNVVIQPADPQVVYVPVYDPGLIYGYPVPLWPGFYPWWGGYGPYLSFGVGFPIGPFFGFGWGWHSWGFGWGGRGILYAGGPYRFQSHAFYDRNAYNHGNFRGAAPFARGDRDMRGFGGNRGGEGHSYSGARSSGTRSGAFGGYARGGDTRSFSSRGQASMGGGIRSGGGAVRGGGGGARGGGGRR